jgi:hypothetical protein
MTATALPAQDVAWPEFHLDGGLSTADFVSVAEGVRSTTAFTLRFSTRFPTRARWFLPVVGASFTPWGSTGATERNTDAPTIYAGNVFRLTDAAGGWLSLELPVLVTHAPGATTSGNRRDYGRDLVVQPSVVVHLGARMFREFGPLWSHFDLFAFAEQNLTPNRDTAGNRDRFNPTAFAGAALTLSGSKPN